ncbi:hypothetical protein ACFRAE_13735 [Sphingobacterium sp. HJSM2_6]|uniref:hypothetical protein n=1 Tax=Sphingobacterium sp. HJSM2_6 TaxID=3366264 RepID=UPI003BE8A269
MSAIRLLAIFNFIIVTVNFIWIILLDNQYVYGQTIETAVKKYHNPIAPAIYTYNIWIFIALVMILVSYIMYSSTNKAHLNFKTIRKVQKIDIMLILNQMFCGLSMVLKLNDQFIISVLCSIGCAYTLLVINRRINIRMLTSNSITRYFIRLAFGIYLGWILVVITFNSTLVFNKFLYFLDPSILLGMSVGLLIVLVVFGSYYAIRNLLPSVIVAICWGLYGMIFQIQIDQLETQRIFLPLLYTLLSISVMVTIYSYYLCTSRRAIGVKPVDPAASIL